MTNPYGYPAQQGPGYGGYGQGGYPAPQQRPGGVTAILAAVFGLLAAVGGGLVLIRALVQLGDLGVSIGDLPGNALTSLGLFMAAALFGLLGAVITFFRSAAGAILLLIGAVVGLAAFFLYPALLKLKFGRFMSEVFGFGDAVYIGMLALLVFAPLTLIFAALPPTFRYLRYRAPVAGFDPSQGGGYPQQQAPGYPQQQPGYPPQQGPQQQGYPPNQGW
ncbi:hypothetical protein [Amycolatopsis sp. CA-230715]|uniref:hypothetical protein n=1 Tax=Amycolatopsis sp. CA-230715 TaxID=2745196 RepID=UPI001C02AFA7|nr:hypothetical protein [Amycolatopsis sp. CA-230715]QWF82105.1 hypothetical protein HUW46_05542 [Amycolatopsis sp. CA-230715]